MRHSFFTSLVIAGLLVSGNAAADWADYRPIGDDAYYVRAKVVHVKPIVRVVQVSTPREVCWNERVPRHRHRRHGSGFTPTIVGGIVGGVLGNQFGSGRGKVAMTVAGAALGASIGHDVSRKPARGTARYTTERRCEIEDVVYDEERVEGYRVRYRYQGRTFATRLDEHPGSTIRVRVQVEPAAYNSGDRTTSRRRRFDCDDICYGTG